MKLCLRILVPALPLVLVLGLSACTIQTTPVASPNSGESPPDSNNDSASGDAPPEDGTPREAPPASTVPAALADTSWTWVTSAGAVNLAFAANGTYTEDVFLNGHPGDSCGTEYLARYAGTATFTTDTLTLRPTSAERTKTDSCTDRVISTEAIEQRVETSGWRIADDGTGRESLVLKDEDGNEHHYYRD